MNRKIFVAGPFNHPDKEVMDYRTKTIAEYCVKIFNEGNFPVSALLSGLSFANYGNLPTDTETWRNFSIKYVEGCDELHILKLEGWEESSGLKTEIATAERLGILIKYFDIYEATKS